MGVRPQAPAVTPEGQMPDLRGLSAREALRTLTSLGLNAQINGNGVVVEQSPAAGTVLGSQTRSILKMGRYMASAAAGEPQ
jgi:beta-lactam-binding protein with PASTA domain